MTEPRDVPPVSPDRPFVDGAERSSDDLRAEVEQRSDPGQQDAEASVREVREELRATVAELSGRLDVPARARHRAVQVRGDAMATARSRPGLIGAIAAVLVLAVVFRRVRAASTRA